MTQVERRTGAHAGDEAVFDSEWNFSSQADPLRAIDPARAAEILSGAAGSS
jgi:hypothetical protein